MIEKILKKLKTARNCADWIAVEDVVNIVQEVAKEYGKETNVRSNGWIPCSERLPKENGYYLTCDEYGNIHTFYHYKDEKYPFAIAPSNQRFYPPVAWQPLPAPYQKGE